MAMVWECGCRLSGRGWYLCKKHENQIAEQIELDNDNEITTDG